MSSYDSVYNGKVIYNMLASDSNIAYEDEFVIGDSIEQITKTLFRLKGNQVYLISYNLNTNVKNNGYVSINTRVDGINKEELTSFVERGKDYSNVTINNSFIVKTDCYDKYLDFLMFSSNKFINLIGDLSIMRI